MASKELTALQDKAKEALARESKARKDYIAAMTEIDAYYKRVYPNQRT